MEIKHLSKSAAKGTRPHMEDTNVVYMVSKEDGVSLNGTLLAVFDGHGGQDSSEFCARNVVRFFVQSKGMEITDRLFDAVAELSNGIEKQGFEDGTTASIVYVDHNRAEATVAVIGDSPVIIHNPTKGTWYGPDHNVRTNPVEMNAAIERGGHMYGGYICNAHGEGLQMGRALGDKHLGKILSREPDIFIVDIEEGGWVLVGTDGLFDPSHKSDKSLQDTVKLLTDYPEVEADVLVSSAIINDTGDNVTAILARF